MFHRTCVVYLSRREADCFQSANAELSMGCEQLVAHSDSPKDAYRRDQEVGRPRWRAMPVTDSEHLVGELAWHYVRPALRVRYRYDHNSTDSKEAAL
jgi:hypothetical protein